MIKVGIINVSSCFFYRPLIIFCKFMNLLVLRHFTCPFLAHCLILWLWIMPWETTL
jgi:hypothetical protein